MFIKKIKSRWIKDLNLSKLKKYNQLNVKQVYVFIILEQIRPFIQKHKEKPKPQEQLKKKKTNEKNGNAYENAFPLIIYKEFRKSVLKNKGKDSKRKMTK